MYEQNENVFKETENANGNKANTKTYHNEMIEKQRGRQNLKGNKRKKVVTTRNPQ